MRSVVECFRGKGVRIFRLEREGVLKVLRERAQRLVVEHPEVLEVRLFGSLARGGGGPGSDADIVIQVNASTERFLDRGDAYRPFFERVGVGCDLLVYTAEEWAQLGREGRLFRRVADEEGIVLAARPRSGLPVVDR